MAGAAAEKCDAIVVLVGETFKPGKDPLSRLAADALKARDLEPKPGKLLQAYRSAGIAAPRVVLAGVGRWLGQTGADRRAGGRGQLAHLGSQAPGDLPARRRRRRRRAGRRGRDGRGQLCLCRDQIQARRPRTATRDHRRGRRRALQGRVRRGQGRGQRHRVRPRTGATCRPTWPRPRVWATKRRNSPRRMGSSAKCWAPRKSPRSAWVRSWRWPRARSSRRASSCCSTRGPPPSEPPLVLVGKGITFDIGRHLDQALAGHGRDEVRHGRRGQRAGHLPRHRRT